MKTKPIICYPKEKLKPSNLSIYQEVRKNIKVLVTKAKGKKCSRCWKILDNPCERNNCGLKN